MTAPPRLPSLDQHMASLATDSPEPARHYNNGHNGLSEPSTSTPEAPPREETRSSSVPRPQRPAIAPTRSRTRSTSSSNFLHRLTSRNSVISVDSPSIAESDGSGLSGKPDRDALSKPRGKYKSGINWDSAILLPSHDSQAYLDQASPTQSPAEEMSSPLDDEEARQRLAAGSTSAARDYYRGLGTSAMVFPAQQRALIEASMRAAVSNRGAAAAGTSRHVSGGGHTNGQMGVNGYGNRPSQTPSPQMSFRTSPPPGPSHASTSAPMSGSRSQGLVPPMSRGGTSPHSLASSSDERVSGPRTASATPPPSQRGGERLTPISTTHDEEEAGPVSKSPAPSVKSGKQRRGFLGIGSKSTDKVYKAGKNGRAGSESSPQLASSEDGPPRRRFPNTRELDVVASELANEAAIEAYGMPTFGPHGSWGPSGSGSRTPVDRRGSGPGSNNAGIAPGAFNYVGSPYSSPSSNSSHSNGNGFQPFMPPFARPDGHASPTSSIHTSPISSTAHELAPSSRPAFSPKPSALSSISATQNDGLHNVPREMFIGIGDNAFPIVPSSAMTDSYAGSDASGFQSGSGTPRRPTTGPGAAISVGSALGPPSGGSRKGSVLSMSMHDPQAETQGLTKQVKSGKSTPWGSRAPSRSVTPKTSAKNLSELAKAQTAQLQARLSNLTGVNGGSSSSSSSTGLNGGGFLGRKISPEQVRAALPTPVVEESAIPFRTPVGEEVPGYPQPAEALPSAATNAAPVGRSTSSSSMHSKTSKKDKRRSFFTQFGNSKGASDLPISGSVAGIANGSSRSKSNGLATRSSSNSLAAPGMPPSLPSKTTLRRREPDAAGGPHANGSQSASASASPDSPNPNGTGKGSGTGSRTTSWNFLGRASSPSAGGRALNGPNRKASGEMRSASAAGGNGAGGGAAGAGGMAGGVGGGMKRLMNMFGSSAGGAGGRKSTEVSRAGTPVRAAI
ncbi:hypothetical protein BCV69DRAFT_38303 [Microstroma glucosiphilum]|uniref:Uncharacterized protein n=1 Tax=Pseudomicrostroma glucosiphilum TaxID=1684307 RepID=A0A316U4L4_9BASI|nr:hypothetical protein BCV69DRAFT_38303 [Pseudomicrostroma glucosiphilum]PWN19411.1 hypothetical protein BCV69DRAFT_38303 [Pseudomicrostroma glucosiphilum]